jgi:hypothetical protein
MKYSIKLFISIFSALQLFCCDRNCINKKESIESEIIWRKKNLVSKDVVTIINDYINCCAIDKICILYCTSFDGNSARFRLFGLSNTNANLLVPQYRYKIQPTGFIRIKGHVVFIYTHFDLLFNDIDNFVWEESKIFEDDKIIINWDEENKIFIYNYIDATFSNVQWEIVVSNNNITVNKDLPNTAIFPNFDTAKIESPIRFVPPE